MKTFFLPFVLFATSAFAQPTPDPSRMVQRLTTLLTLTAAQQTEATAIFTAEVTALTPIEANVKTARTALKAAVKANTTPAIDSVSAQLGAYSGQVTDIQSKAQAAFYAILTADQQTKYDSLPGGGFGGGPGRGGPMGR